MLVSDKTEDSVILFEKSARTSLRQVIQDKGPENSLRDDVNAATGWVWSLSLKGSTGPVTKVRMRE